MANKKCSELEAELQELKAQMRALAAQAPPRADAPSVDVQAEPAPEPPGSEPLDFDELVALLKVEVEGLNPLTCLAIFGLGVLTGRLLNR